MSKDVSQRWFEEVWGKNNDGVIRELAAEDAVGHLEGGLEICGVAEFEQFRAALIAAIPDFQVEVLQVVSEGDLNCVLWRGTGTHTGDGMGLVPTQEAVSILGTSWQRIREGKICEAWDTWNHGALMQKLTIATPASVS
jgi:predicted ester cyclase